MVSMDGSDNNNGWLERVSRLGEADVVATAGRERCGASGRREGALHDGARAYLDTFALGVSSLEGVDGKRREGGW